MNKSIGCLLFSCILMLNTSLSYSSEANINYLKNLKKYTSEFPALATLTVDNAKDVINTLTPDGETLLENVIGLTDYQAAQPTGDLRQIKGDLKAAKAIVELGGDINIRDKNDTTPLMMAAFTGQDDIVKYLLYKGADRTLENNFQNQKTGKPYTALSYAQESRDKYADKSYDNDPANVIVPIKSVRDNLNQIIVKLQSAPVNIVPKVPAKPATKLSEPTIIDKRGQLLELQDKSQRLSEKTMDLQLRIMGKKRDFEEFKGGITKLFEKIANFMTLEITPKLGYKGPISNIDNQLNEFAELQQEYNQILSDLNNRQKISVSSGADFFEIVTPDDNVNRWLDDLLDIRSQFQNFQFDPNANVPEDLKEKYEVDRKKITDYIDRVAENFKEEKNKVQLATVVGNLKANLADALYFLKQVNAKAAARLSYRRGDFNFLNFDKGNKR